MYNSENDLVKTGLAIGGAIISATLTVIKVKDIDKDAIKNGRDGLAKQIGDWLK